MNRLELKRYLDEGLSLEQIGRLVDRDPSTVGYWVKKYGLEANGKRKHAARGALTEEALRPLVERGLTLAEIAEELDRSMSTVRYWIRRLGLDAPKRARKQAVEEALAEGRRTVLRECKRHGQTLFVIENSGRVRCRQCRMDAVAERRRKVKRILIEEAGGRCARCGYDRFVGALHFHHVDPKTKHFGVAQKGATIGIDSLRAEAAKCIVLCANCHAEVEHGTDELALK